LEAVEALSALRTMEVASLWAEVLPLLELTDIVASPKVRRGMKRGTAEQLKRSLSV